jgi:serine protease AprX
VGHGQCFRAGVRKAGDGSPEVRREERMTAAPDSAPQATSPKEGPGLNESQRDTLLTFAHRTFGHERFTQDSPIRPDVWMAYWTLLSKRTPPAPEASGATAVAPAPKDAAPGAKRKGLEPGPLVDLIIVPREGVEPGQAAIMMEHLKLPKPRHLYKPSKELTAFRTQAELAYSRDSVFAKLCFRDLLQLVVPLTSWWDSMLKTMKLQQKMAAAKAAADSTAAPAAKHATDDAHERQEVGKHFVGRVTASVKDATDKQVWGSIDQAVTVGDGSFQMYRFSALASLTLFWLDNPAKPIEEIVKIAEDLSKPNVQLNKIEPLVASFRTALELVDAGAAHASGKGPMALDKSNETRLNDRLDPSRVRLFSVSVNRAAKQAVARSRKTVKADAAANVFDIDLSGIAWAVLDSGIDAKHAAFLRLPAKSGRTDKPAGKEKANALRWFENTRIKASYDFTYIRTIVATSDLPRVHPDQAPRKSDDAVPGPPQDQASHAAPESSKAQKSWDNFRRYLAREHKETLERVKRRRQIGSPLDWDLVEPLIRVPHNNRLYRAPLHEHGTHVAGILAADCEMDEQKAQNATFSHMSGVCAGLELYDIRCFDGKGEGNEDNIVYAFEFIEHLNRSRNASRRVHGVNLSLAVPHDVRYYACGQTKVCQAANDLVRSGVVVVAAAGNQGYEGDVALLSLGQNARDISITDPGNAELVITVGSTHWEKPHAYGVSYFSSRGPTADGRMKPDLVAPGEKIFGPIPGGFYKQMDGTSMAAPHVSGVAALLMARHRELVGQPDRVKEILCRTATSLNRLTHFQGAGLVDALRALQSV